MIAVAVVAVFAAACGSDPVEPAPQVTTAASSSSAAASVAPATSSAKPSPAAAEPTVTRTTKPPAKTTKKPAPVATDVLTGLKVTSGPLIAAKIDNTSAGLPQFGVAEADIVYVEQVEGGLTRLVALFRSTLPEEVGPIRSVRSTDSELLSMYGTPGLVFSGGAGGPLEMLADTPVVNLSADTAGDAYWRSEFGDGTHNLHVNLAKLGAETEGLGTPKSPGFVFRRDDPRLPGYPRVAKLAVTLQSSTTTFQYVEGGQYLATHGTGRQYVDHDGTPVEISNVLVQNVVDEPDGTVDSVGSPSYLSHTVGEGTFTLYRSGRAITGTWSRSAADTATKYLGKDGTPVSFRPGRTWVMLAPQNAQVTEG